jgi:histidinol-phosphate aminotransferase
MDCKFLSDTARKITPYVPGEQPQDKKYIKLNTNECPYPPSPEVIGALADFVGADLRLYPDPDMKALCREMAEYYHVPESYVFAGGGSDEVLGFAFMAFCNRGSDVYFPDITYGFYKVYADLFGQNIHEIPLDESFCINPDDYINLRGAIFIANPNAPTGIALERGEIERILKANPGCLVVVDEAYADFAEDCSCVDLIGGYDNLLVVQTFSKSRALAGMRLGFGFGKPGLIDALNRIKYSFNPYNIDRVSQAVAIAAIRDHTYFKKITADIVATREQTAKTLTGMGFNVLPSRANFLFAAHSCIPGGELYAKLKERGILVRHFQKERISGFVRITIGTEDEMQTLISTIQTM